MIDRSNQTIFLNFRRQFSIISSTLCTILTDNPVNLFNSAMALRGRDCNGEDAFRIVWGYHRLCGNVWYQSLFVVPGWCSSTVLHYRTVPRWAHDSGRVLPVEQLQLLLL
jgi:hypothetical protein